MFTPQEVLLVLVSVRGRDDPRANSTAGRIMSMKNSNDTIGNRTRDLPVCSAVPQPTALRRASESEGTEQKNRNLIIAFQIKE